jgi:hypothetical protein
MMGEQSFRTLALAAAYAAKSMAIPQNGGVQVQVKSTALASRRIVAVDIDVLINLKILPQVVAEKVWR